MMTRKHYQLLAQALGEAFREDASPSLITSRLITALTSDNPNFDRTKFIKAIEKAEAN
jgi:hypothetical protein